MGIAGAIYRSSDGVTWTAQNAGTTARLYSIVWSGELFAAVGEDGTVLTSPDGATWIAHSAGITAVLRGVAWVGDRFIAVGGGRDIVSSLDGTTWEATTLPESYGELAGITAAGSRAVVVGDSGLVLTWR